MALTEADRTDLATAITHGIKMIPSHLKIARDLKDKQLVKEEDDYVFGRVCGAIHGAFLMQFAKRNGRMMDAAEREEVQTIIEERYNEMLETIRSA